MSNKPYVDISGQRFGRLVAKEKAFRSNGSTRWLCVCDCGKDCIVGLSQLKSSNTFSCGCLRKEMAAKQLGKRRRAVFGFTDVKLGKTYTYYTRNARKRGHKWEITTKEFEEALKAPCFYCGYSLKVGIDRVDSHRSYNNKNIVACCTSCNQAKNDKSVEEFADWVKRIHAHLQSEKWSG